MSGLSYPGTPDRPKEWSSSLHEIGHVLLAIVCDHPVHSVEISRGGGSGFFLSHSDAGTQSWSETCQSLRKINPPLSSIINHLAVYYGAGIAQMDFVHGGLNLRTSCSGDFEDANALLDTFCENQAQRGFLRSQAISKASETIAKYSAIAWTLAMRLYTHRRLDRDQILDAVRDSPGGRALLAGTTRYRREQYRYVPRDNARPADAADLRFRTGTLLMRPAISEERQRRILKALAVRELAAEGFHLTESNINWWVAEILQKRNGQNQSAM